MRSASRWLLLLGLAATTLLIAWQGIGTIAGLLASASWRLLAISLFAIPNLWICALSWHLLFAPGAAPSLGSLVRALWIGSSVNSLMPVASVGGEVVRARVLALEGRDLPDVVASVVLDKTVMVTTLPLSALLGTLLLVRRGAGDLSVVGLLAGAAAMAVALALFVGLQRSGALGIFVRRVVGDESEPRRWVATVTAVDERLRALYGRPHRIVAALALRFGARVFMSAELWLAALWIGTPIGVVDAILLRCLTQAARGAAFAVPAGLGVQEGTFVVAGAAIGLSPEVSLALSLVSRVREIIPGIPGLLAWQLAEGRGLLRRRVEIGGPDE